MKSNMSTKMLYVKSLSPHYHQNELEILVVLKGTIHMYKLDRMEVIHQGQFVMVNKNITHWLKSNGAYVLISKIDLKRFRHIYEKIEYVEFYHIKETIDTDLKQRLNGVIIDCVIKNFIYQNFQIANQEITLNENQLMSTLYSFYRLNSFMKEDDEFVSNELLDRYYHVVEYVNKHIHEKIVVDDVLKHLYMNSTYFSQFMKKVGGWGFKEFVSYVKFTKVVQYLISEELTMTEIASEVGITDMKSFYNSFKKYFHISPSKWRKSISHIENEYIYCFDDQILKEYIHKYNIANHQINTITKSYKTLLEYQMNNVDLNEVKMFVRPYDDMKDYNSKYYQVYKNLTLLIKKADELGVKIDFVIPIHCLKDEEHENLLKNLLIENTKLYSSHDLRKWEITLLAESKSDIEKAQNIKESFKQILKNNIVNISIC